MITGSNAETNMVVLKHSGSREYQKTWNLIVRRLILNLLKILRISDGNGIHTEQESEKKGELY